jgi:DNA-binding HxlR family transcriptional regulator
LTSGEFTINGFRAKHIQKRFEQYSSSKISRILKRLRKLGIIKKGPKCYKYYITKTGLEAITTALKLKNLVIIPQLNTQIAA